MILSVAGMHPRSLSVKVLALGSALTFIIFLYLSNSPRSLTSVILSAFTRPKGKCPPRAFSNGSWSGPHPRANATRMTSKTQALGFAGFDGCASSREVDWHLASDNEQQWDRFPDAQSYVWKVGSQDGCDGLEELSGEKLLKHLVEDGGWLLVGDSITEGHFFSLSCILYPHVIATPTYTPGAQFDRAWPQNLYLNPESPLLRSGELSLPHGFNITSTPLATFRRIDLLLSQAELVELHSRLYPDAPSDFSLFSNEATWSISPHEYLELFFEGGYSTMVVSTAGHWTVTLFGGYDERNSTSLPAGAKPGIEGVIDFFGHAMREWADVMQGALDQAAVRERGKKRRQVLVRSYLTGHEDCHDERRPWTEVKPLVWNWYNWGQIGTYNDVFEEIVSSKKYPNIHYLSVERPGRLRPDAHATGDCLHIMVGAGVMEGWSHYIWHYVTKELRRT